MPSQPGTIGTLLKCLRRGEAVLLACDRDIDKNGISINFFGEETTLPTVAVRIAMKTGAALVPIFSRRVNRGYEVNLEAAIEMVGKRNDASVADNVKKVARVIEDYIRRSPEQWVVLSPIWLNTLPA